MVTYQTIKDYIKEKHGINVKSGWIAHAKESMEFQSNKLEIEKVIENGHVLRKIYR